MNKKLIISAVFIVAAIGGITFAATTNDNEADLSSTTPTISADSPQEQSAETTDISTELAKDDTGQNQAKNDSPQAPAAESNDNNAAPGAYVDYSASALASAEGKKVLFFHAPWCPQCRSVEAGIIQDGVPAGYTIVKVDYDSNQDLRQKYGVTLQTTFVKLDSNNDAESKYVAYSEPTFSAVKRNYL